jgi:hypothetical protein
MCTGPSWPSLVSSTFAVAATVLLGGCLESVDGGGPPLGDDGTPQPRGAVTFSKSYGGAGDDTANDVIATADGGYAFVGRAEVGSVRDVENCAGSNAERCTNDMIWLTKLDALGDVEWSTGYYQPRPDDTAKTYRSVPVGDGTSWLFGSYGRAVDARRVRDSDGLVLGEYRDTLSLPRENCLEPERAPNGVFRDGVADADGFLYALGHAVGYYDANPFDSCSVSAHVSTYLMKLSPTGQLVWQVDIDDWPIPRWSSWMFGARSYQVLGLGDLTYVLINVGEGLDSPHLLVAAYRSNGSLAWRRDFIDQFTMMGFARLIDTDGDGGLDGLLIPAGEERAVFDDADARLVLLDPREGTTRWDKRMRSLSTASGVTWQCDLPDLPCVIFVAGAAPAPGDAWRGGGLALLDARDGEVLRERIYPWEFNEPEPKLGINPQGVRTTGNPAAPFEATFQSSILVNEETIRTFARFSTQLEVVSLERLAYDYEDFRPRGVDAPASITGMTAQSVTALNDGSLVVLGQLRSARLGGPWLMRVDSTGRPLWRQRIAAPKGTPTSIGDIVTAGDQIVTGFVNPPTLVSLGADGDVRWARGLPYASGHSSRAIRLVADANDGVLALDTSTATLYGFTEQGELRFARRGAQLGGSPLNLRDISHDGGASAWVLATPQTMSLDALGREDAPDSPQNAPGLDLHRVILLNIDPATADVLLARQLTFSPDSRMGRLNPLSLQIASASDGGAWVTMTASRADESDGAENLAVLKVDAAGELALVRLYGGLASEEVTAARSTGDGGLVVSAVSDSLGGRNEAWVLRLGPDGGVIPNCNAEITLVDADWPFDSELLDPSALLVSVGGEAESASPGQFSLEHLELPAFDLRLPAVARQCQGEAQRQNVFGDEVTELAIRSLGTNIGSYTVEPSIPLVCQGGLCSAPVTPGTSIEIVLDADAQRRLHYAFGCDDELAFGRCRVQVDGDREVILAYRDPDPGTPQVSVGYAWRSSATDASMWRLAASSVRARTRPVSRTSPWTKR